MQQLLRLSLRLVNFCVYELRQKFVDMITEDLRPIDTVTGWGFGAVLDFLHRWCPRITYRSILSRIRLNPLVPTVPFWGRVFNLSVYVPFFLRQFAAFVTYLVAK